MACSTSTVCFRVVRDVWYDNYGDHGGATLGRIGGACKVD
jgi:hypothetical protein